MNSSVGFAREAKNESFPIVPLRSELNQSESPSALTDGSLSFTGEARVVRGRSAPKGAVRDVRVVRASVGFVPTCVVT